MNQYFDLHLHPIFKNHICHYDENIAFHFSSLEDLTKPIRMSNVITSILDEFALHILKGQSSIEQCQKGNVKFAAAAIANLEFGFADSKGFFGNILRSKMSHPLDQAYFDKIRNGEVSYYRTMLMELSLYKQLRDHHKVVNIVSRNGKVKPSDSKLNILINLEGSHNFSKYKVGNSLEIDSIPDRFIDVDQKILLSQTADHLWREIIIKKDENNQNIPIENKNPADNFKRFYQNLAKEKMDLFYLTLTHLTHINEQFLATHAFGMKMLKHPAFYPFGNGITNLGYQIIEQCYTMTNNLGEERPIVIDIKHLGLKSRQDLYEIRATKYKNKKIPIIASHIGVTGYSYNEWKNALQREKCIIQNYKGARAISIEMERKMSGKWGSFVNNDFSFNPWSINLMDEDIEQVLESGGLLGISLDVRILGFQSEFGINFGSDSEFLSTSDFQTHFPQIGVKNLPTKTVESTISETESWLIPTKEDRHPLAFCFNIIHIIQVGLLKTSIKEPWKHICIGSDFDGLIEPLKISPDIASYKELEANMKKWLPVAEKAYIDENGGQEVINTMNFNINNFVEDILYTNGKNFVDLWLNNFKK